jgi:hypothetical protein
MKRLCFVVALFTLVSCATPGKLVTENETIYLSQPTQDIVKNELIELETRKYPLATITQKFILIKPTDPVASVVLFEGGMGDIGLTKSFGAPFPKYNKEGFLARNRELIARHGIMVALLDSPSDLPDGYYQVDRIGEKHREDMKAVISYLKKEADVPIWGMSMSNSTLSATSLAINFNDDVVGIVCASARIKFPYKWKPIRKVLPNGVLDVAKDIKIPTLFVHHENDKCKNTPLRLVNTMKSKMVNCPNVELLVFSGGKPPASQSCYPLSQHGFYGIEDLVIENVAGFIKENSYQNLR